MKLYRSFQNRVHAGNLIVYLRSFSKKNLQACWSRTQDHYYRRSCSEPLPSCDSDIVLRSFGHNCRRQTNHPLTQILRKQNFEINPRYDGLQMSRLLNTRKDFYCSFRPFLPSAAFTYKRPGTNVINKLKHSRTTLH